MFDLHLPSLPVEFERAGSRDFRSPLAKLRLLAGTACVSAYNPIPARCCDGRSRQGGLGLRREWLELTGLVRTLWRLRQPRPVTKAFGTRNSRYIASALERLRSAGFVKEVVVGDTRYVYLAERACGLLLLLGYSPEELMCGEAALRLIWRRA
ncbi:hypothetical protein [Infirmifilum sp. SLHALR2]|nr:MAG: hypothetical protein B7L53_02840 [Thermofilum sp. NZ13]